MSVDFPWFIISYHFLIVFNWIDRNRQKNKRNKCILHWYTIRTIDTCINHFLWCGNFIILLSGSYNCITTIITVTTVITVITVITVRLISLMLLFYCRFNGRNLASAKIWCFQLFFSFPYLCVTSRFLTGESFEFNFC